MNKGFPTETTATKPSRYFGWASEWLLAGREKIIIGVGSGFGYPEMFIINLCRTVERDWNLQFKLGNMCRIDIFIGLIQGIHRTESDILGFEHFHQFGCGFSACLIIIKP